MLALGSLGTRRQRLQTVVVLHGDNILPSRPWQWHDNLRQGPIHWQLMALCLAQFVGWTQLTQTT